MLNKLLPILLLFVLLSVSKVFSQSLADSGYYYQKIGFKEKASEFFENCIYSNPDQVRPDLAYLYMDMKQLSKASEQFENVNRNSTSEKEIQQSKESITYIDSPLNPKNNNQTTPIYSPGVTYADSGYYYLNQGNKTKAAEFFELHLKDNPKDYKIRLQLGYIYYDQKKLSSALTHFDYVGKNSTVPEDVETALSASFVIREELAITGKRSLDLYFYNYYDSYQKNYIANLVMHVNFKIADNFYGGPYLDLYTDTRSSPALIYNDRFFEIGGFMRYSILRNLFIEFRIGFTRQVDLDTSRINIKPMLVYFTRFGNAKVYSAAKSSSKISLYMDFYSAAMYDYKYDNAFLQATLQQALRFSTGGYSYIETYLVETGQFDSRRLDYNNYSELGAGLRFKPSVMFFPVIFVEPTYKAYFYGNRENSFQVKAGFMFNFRTKL